LTANSDMPTITIYPKPTCTTCRQTIAILKESGVDFNAVDYYIEPIPKKKLKQLLEKMKLSPHEILRRKESIYKMLRLHERNLTVDELIELMVRHPDLIQRPIVEKGGKAVLARPAERIREIL
jgi:arsenate reductase (glutaredoxin)